MENREMLKERWQQAVKASSNAANYRRNRGYTQTKDDAFVDGVQWADENPNSELVKKIKERLINGAIDWMMENVDFRDNSGGYERALKIENFRKAMTDYDV